MLREPLVAFGGCQFFRGNLSIPLFQLPGAVVGFFRGHIGACFGANAILYAGVEYLDPFGWDAERMPALGRLFALPHMTVKQIKRLDQLATGNGLAVGAHCVAVVANLVEPDSLGGLPFDE